MSTALAPDRQQRTERTFLGAKLLRASHLHGYPDGGIGHWCPGCCTLHVFPCGVANRGTLAAPDFEPDRLVTWRGVAFGARDLPPLVPGGRCHYRIVTGLIAYAHDCSHRLAGLTVPLPDLPGHLRE